MGDPAMVSRLRRPGTAVRHAERMATPWLGINHDCGQAINTEVKHELSDSEIAVQCRALDLPVLIIDGIEDIRPRWAVDSLHQALTNSQRMKLARSGHLRGSRTLTISVQR
ncbi:hypothetical protein [Salinispora oceanensis]|uniref:hypothetical protein n=1 Tax=Salinispora oceanensis TaxID=1050199 RepID=UPI00039D9CDB|nr:hypothetical protein [Salinispora oceanensis]